MVLNSLVIYTQNEEQNVDGLKFRIDLVEGLLLKNSVLRRVSVHHDGEIIVKRMTESHFPRSIHPPEGNVSQKREVCCLQQT